MKKTLFSGKSKHTKLYTAITLVLVCFLFFLNLGISYLFGQKLWIVDLTPEGLYTLSDKMVEVCDGMLNPEGGEPKEIKITFCTDPDYLIESDMYRYTYFLALALENKFDNINVETVNVKHDPTAVSMYKTTSRDTIAQSDVIISYGGKYRITSLLSFWTLGSNDEIFGYDGEYKMASIIASLTAIDRPIAYFSTGNGETYYDPENPDSENSKSAAYLADLLNERGLAIKTIDISKEERIPEDCVLLIINNPTRDFTYDENRLDDLSYVSDTEKIDRYLVKDYGSLIVNKSYEIDLPVLENFLAEWGIGFGDQLVSDPDNILFSSTDPDSKDTLFTGVYDADSDSLGAAYYGSYSSLTSAPKMVFKNTGYMYCAFENGDALIEHGNRNGSRFYTPIMSTSKNAYSHVGSAKDIGEKSLIATSVRTHLDSFTAERTYSYILCTNSADFFSNEILGNPTYANYDVMASIITNISRTDKYATTELGGDTANSPLPGGKRLVSTTLSKTQTSILSPDLTQIVGTKKGLNQATKRAIIITVMAVPVAISAAGIAVFIKRKFL